MAVATGDPRTDRELRERIADFETYWNRLPLDVREEYALDVGHLRLLQRLADQYTAQAHPAGEHLRAAVAALQAGRRGQALDALNEICEGID